MGIAHFIATTIRIHSKRNRLEFIQPKWHFLVLEVVVVVVVAVVVVVEVAVVAEVCTFLAKFEPAPLAPHLGEPILVQA